MGCPTGMPDADMRGFFIILLHLFSETCQLPLYLDGMNPIMINGNTGRVIPTIFQFGQTVQQYGNSLIFTNISYDSAHKFQPPTFYSFVAFLLSGALTALFCKKACDPERKGEEHPPNFRYGKQKILKMLSALLPRQPPNLRLWRLKTLLTFLSFILTDWQPLPNFVVYIVRHDIIAFFPSVVKPFSYLMRRSPVPVYEKRQNLYKFERLLLWKF